MTIDQVLTLVVLVAVVAALIWDKVRSDVVALSGAAVLLMTGVVRPIEVQGAFASPAIIALASLFVIAYAMELTGLLDRAIELAVKLCSRIGSFGLWILLGLSGGASAFLNNTPIVVLGAPVIRDVAEKLALDPKLYLMPLSYVAVLGGCMTLIGTSTNLLVDGVVQKQGMEPFGIFDILPVGLVVTLAGGAFMALVGHRLLPDRARPLLAACDAGTLDDAGVDALQRAMVDSGVRDRAEQAVAHLVDRAHRALDDLDVDPEAEVALRDLAEAVAWRSA